MQKILRCVGMLVENEFGVLTRISYTVRRQGFNIRSLAVTETDNPEISKMILSLECLESRYEPILDRLRRLSCVTWLTAMGEDVDFSQSLEELFDSIGLFEEVS